MWMPLKQKLSQWSHVIRKKISARFIREYLHRWRNRGSWPGASSPS
jgi:hypothetical protein